MGCNGCRMSIDYVWISGNPLQVARQFISDQGQDPHGKCGGSNCQQISPCFPIGTVTITDLQMTPSHLRAHYKTFIGGTWSDYTLQGVGEGMFFRVPGIEVACGSRLVCAEIYDDDQDPPALLGTVDLVCSACVP